MRNKRKQKTNDSMRNKRKSKKLQNTKYESNRIENYLHIGCIKSKHKNNHNEKIGTTDMIRENCRDLQ